MAFRCPFGGCFSGLRDADDVAGDFGAACGGFSHVAADVVGCRCLLFDGGGDDVRDFIHFRDDLTDFRDGFDGAFGVALDGFHFAGDVVGCRGGGFGEFLDLVCDDGEAFA